MLNLILTCMEDYLFNGGWESGIGKNHITEANNNSNCSLHISYYTRYYWLKKVLVWKLLYIYNKKGNSPASNSFLHFSPQKMWNKIKKKSPMSRPGCTVRVSALAGGMIYSKIDVFLTMMQVRNVS